MSKKNEKEKRRVKKLADEPSGLLDAQGKKIPPQLTPHQVATESVLRSFADMDAAAVGLLDVAEKYLRNLNVPLELYPDMIERAKLICAPRHGVLAHLIAGGAQPPSTGDAPGDDTATEPPTEANDTEDDKPS